jgi:hypothetical protein
MNIYFNPEITDNRENKYREFFEKIISLITFPLCLSRYDNYSYYLSSEITMVSK